MKEYIIIIALILLSWAVAYLLVETHTLKEGLKLHKKCTLEFADIFSEYLAKEKELAQERADNSDEFLKEQLIRILSEHKIIMDRITWLPCDEDLTVWVDGLKFIKPRFNIDNEENKEKSV